jgi:acid phosphatase (class A)
MRKSLLLTAVTCLLPLHVGAEPGAHYLRSDPVPFRAILGDPPAPGSEETKREIEAVLREQRLRTPADIARIEAEAKAMVRAFAEILGPRLTPRELPVTFALIINVGEDVKEPIEEAKLAWSRSRPWEDDARIKPAIALPTGTSYPAALAVSARVYAQVLGELFPEKRSALLARGWLIGWGRVTAGVHFPSDVAAALKLGDYFFQQMLGSPAFQADVAKAREECRQVFAPPLARP